MFSPSRNALLALIGATLVLHTIEEYLTFPSFLRSPGRLERWLPSPSLLQNPNELRVWLLIATVLPLVLIALAILRPSKGLLVSALLLECVLLVNAGWHILVAFIRGGYAPGVITATLVNLPFGIYVLRRAVKEQWIRARMAWRLVAIAVALHIVAVGSFLAG
jgi:hypothetical protein